MAVLANSTLPFRQVFRGNHDCRDNATVSSKSRMKLELYCPLAILQLGDMQMVSVSLVLDPNRSYVARTIVTGSFSAHSRR